MRTFTRHRRTSMFFDIWVLWGDAGFFALFAPGLLRMISSNLTNWRGWTERAETVFLVLWLAGDFVCVWGEACSVCLCSLEAKHSARVSEVLLVGFGQSFVLVCSHWCLRTSWHGEPRVRFTSSRGEPRVWFTCLVGEPRVLTSGLSQPTSLSNCSGRALPPQATCPF